MNGQRQKAKKKNTTNHHHLIKCILYLSTRAVKTSQSLRTGHICLRFCQLSLRHSFSGHPSITGSQSTVYPSNHGEVRGFKPGPIFLWSDGANHCATFCLFQVIIHWLLLGLDRKIASKHVILTSGDCLLLISKQISIQFHLHSTKSQQSPQGPLYCKMKTL